MLFLPFARRRLIFWLVRAYFRRWFGMLVFFFITGVILSTLIFVFMPKTITINNNSNTIGVVGSFTVETLPVNIQRQISSGLTQIKEDGTPTPDIASFWEIGDDGRVYTIKLRNDVYFQDGKKLKASDINYNFRDAKFEIINDSTVRFTLNQPFSPFPTVISKPIFKKGLVGVGEYKVKKAQFNGSFVTSLTLDETKKNNNGQLVYRFYPTQQALTTAFILGEITIIENLYHVDQFNNWPNVTIEKQLSPNELIAVFFNTKGADLSQKNIRQALLYALPDAFAEGESASSPLRPTAFAFTPQSDKFKRNIEKAKSLLGSSLSINLSVDEKLDNVAQQIAKSWEEAGIKTTIETVTAAPTADSNYQAFLGIFHIPPDPDQYILWHSTQQTNITAYSSQKIDKLLEDGRKTQDPTEREKIYADFQKYLVDDAPAAFLYYPTVYTIRRK